MADEIDEKINATRPMVQESQVENHVELVFPQDHTTIIIAEPEAAALCADIMRIVSGIDIEGNDYETED